MSHTHRARQPDLATLDAALTTGPATLPAALMVKLADDPWSLSPQERTALRECLADAQQTWLARIAPLVEPPAPADSFPAFLLATPRFGNLAAGIGESTARRELGTGTADELQRFVDRYRDYLIRA